MTLPALITANSDSERDEETLHFQDLWNAIRRHGLLVALILLVSIGLSAFYAYRATPIFRSTTAIRIDDKASSLPALDALKSLSSTGNQVGTEMQVLETRALAEEVVDSLALQVSLDRPNRTPRRVILSFVKVDGSAPAGLYEFERQPGGRFTVTNATTKGALGTASIGQRVTINGITLELTPGAAQHALLAVRVSDREQTIGAFARALNVSRPARDANVVNVVYESSDQRLVSEVPNLLARLFITRRQTVQQTEARSTVRFLKQQIDTLRTQLTSAENSLRTFREGAQIVDLAAEAGAKVKALADLQAERSSVDQERSALVQLLNEVNEAAKHQQPDDPSPYRRLVAFPTLLRNQATSGLLASLAAVDDQRTALLARRTESDPDVQALAKRTSDIESQLRSIATTYAEGLTNQVAATDASLNRFGRELERVPAKEIEYARLARDPKILEQIFTLLQTRLKEAEIAQAVEDPNVRIIDPAVNPLRPVSPRKKLIVALGLLVGLFGGVGLALAREYMDHTVHTREEIQALTGVAVLGLIPRIQPEASKRYLVGSGTIRTRFNALMGRSVPSLPAAHHSDGLRVSGPIMTPLADRLVTGNDPRSPVSEAYRSLRTNITFARPDTPARVIAFTSAMPGEGKSTSSANLAITLAQQGLRVLLIDADLRRGVLNEVFGFARDPGLSNCLMGYATLKDAIKRVQLPESATLDFLPTGTLPPNPAELLSSARMKVMLDEVRDSYDMVIFDTPPTNLVTDAAVIGSAVDGVVVVARAAITRSEALAYAMDLLRQVRAPVLGIVLNDVDFKRDVRYYGAYGTGYYYYAADAKPA
jgi:capsular exopolysaccharide synthesis family protein